MATVILTEMADNIAALQSIIDENLTKLEQNLNYDPTTARLMRCLVSGTWLQHRLHQDQDCAATLPWHH